MTSYYCEQEIGFGKFIARVTS